MTNAMREKISETCMREKHVEQIRKFLRESKSACDDQHQFNPSEFDMENCMRINLKPDYAQPAAPPAALRAALGSLPAVAEEDVPVIGLVGRVGWQNHAMQTRGISRLQAVSTFKAWKICPMRSMLRM